MQLRELLVEASGKTKLQVQELLARRFPRPDVASTIRKLPAPRVTPVPRASALTEETPSASESALTHATPPSPSITTGVASKVTSKPPAEAPASRSAPPARAVVVEPLSAARYRIQLNASPQLKKKLEQARDLLSHANPSGDLATVIERALDLLLERTLKQRFAQTEQPRADRNADHANRKIASNATGNSKLAPGDPRQRATRRGHIANATKREIAARDELRCTFVSSDGQRCGATQFTQIHHEQPWARHGDESPGNLRILCAAHNHLLAERDFGRELVAERIQSRRVSAGASQTDRQET